MRSSALLVAAAGSFATASAFVSAPQITNNVPNTGFVATFVKSAQSNLTGAVVGTAATNGAGVNFAVSFAGFDASEEPYVYHIHQYAVPADGNCTAAGAHLDPYNRTESPACDATQPATCQLGDLAGKHGKITTLSFSASYLDPFLSTTPGSNAYFGDLSVVVHNSSLARIACANFVAQPVPVTNGSTTTSGIATGTGSGSTSTATGIYGNGTASSTAAGTATVTATGTAGGSSSSATATGSGSSTGTGSSPPTATGGAVVNAASVGAVVLGLLAMFV